MQEDSEQDAEAATQRLCAVAEPDDRGDLAVNTGRAVKVENGRRTRQELARRRFEASDHASAADERHLDTAAREPFDDIAGVRDDELEHLPVRDTTNTERTHRERVSDPAGNTNDDGNADAHADGDRRTG